MAVAPTTPQPVARDLRGRPLDLVLFKFDACPYCRKVVRAIERLGVPVVYRDTEHDAGAQEELVRVGGLDQVPCLFVDGRPMYESDDIVAFLEREVRVDS